MTYEHLLAKKPEDPQNPKVEHTLVGHTRQVMQAMEVLHDVLASQVMDFIGDAVSLSAWQTANLAAAWLHDLGKANNHFQNMMRDPHFRQGVRHETLGIVVISEHLDEWLTDFWGNHPAWLKAAVYFSIAGHHLKFPDQKERQRPEVLFLGVHPEFRSFLDIGKELLQLGPYPELANQPYSLLALGGLKSRLSRLRRKLEVEFSPHQKLAIAVMKATLMAADLSGSALPEKGQEIKGWLKARLKVSLNQKSLESLVNRKLKGYPLRPFQKKVQEERSATLLLQAGCGAGKTAAAYLWAAEHAQGKRLFFCYPTTTTASEGFSGYFQDPDFEAILIHSRAKVDYRLLQNMPSLTKTEIELRALNLEALDTWPVPAVVCTAHTVLGLLQNSRRGLYAWPSLAQSVFVFDEIHSFSPRLFQHLLRFLEIFKSIPVLLMTATIPPGRQRALHKICSARGGMAVISGPATRENAKRYILKRSDEDNAWQIAQKVLNKGGKVLWISNTVSRSMTLAKQAFESGLPVQPFHSRYRYRDRLIRQRTVVDGFLPKKPAMLAVTTQVAEISLDLSADLLITEYAPIPALIQRLGRLNRFADEPREARMALFIKPPNPKPYSPEEYHEPAIEDWLNQVADTTHKSQSDLARAFWRVAEQMQQVEYTDTIHCDWIDDPWRSLSNRHALMEPGYTLEIVREEDLALGPSTEMAMPMPIPYHLPWQRWSFRGRYAIAPLGTITYDPFWGGEYARETPGFEII
ncbi:MAG: CRISPR-associated helicase Cas3' [Desulfobacca sp.]|nr:CRISPR-associated helicase Cas3' [Desulfobacca sp.]